MEINKIVNWIFVIISIGIAYYIMKNKNKVYIAIKDKKNKTHKIAIQITDSEQEVMKKIEKYMKKNQ